MKIAYALLTATITMLFANAIYAESPETVLYPPASIQCKNVGQLVCSSYNHEYLRLGHGGPSVPDGTYTYATQPQWEATAGQGQNNLSYWYSLQDAQGSWHLVTLFTGYNIQASLKNSAWKSAGNGFICMSNSPYDCPYTNVPFEHSN